MTRNGIAVVPPVRRRTRVTIGALAVAAAVLTALGTAAPAYAAPGHAAAGVGSSPACAGGGGTGEL